jgi:hypothetical protein
MSATDFAIPVGGVGKQSLSRPSTDTPRSGLMRRIFGCFPACWPCLQNDHWPSWAVPFWQGVFGGVTSGAIVELRFAPYLLSDLTLSGQKLFQLQILAIMAIIKSDCDGIRVDGLLLLV